MFGRGQREREQAERKQSAKQRFEEDRRLFWEMVFKQAEGDEHKMTQAVIKYDAQLKADFFKDWLEDFDRRVAAEIREQAKQTRSYITVAFAILIFAFLYFRD